MISAAGTSILPTMPPATEIEEAVVTIGPPGGELIGVLARPANAERAKAVGVVIVVGGPQTRVGSHRQFVIMARAFAAAGHACLRFDYTGMGDSPGPKPDFEKAGRDIGRACDVLLAEEQACQGIALWGLCDGATAAIFHAQQDPRIAGVIAANPWARSEATRAQAIVAEHYGSRLRSVEFWKRLASGKVNVLVAGGEAIANLLRARRVSPESAGGQVGDNLPARLARVLASPARPVRLQLSGRDLTAAEFEIAMRASGVLEKSRHVTTRRYETADHTFSDPQAWQAVIADTLAWLGELPSLSR